MKSHCSCRRDHHRRCPESPGIVTQCRGEIPGWHIAHFPKSIDLGVRSKGRVTVCNTSMPRGQMTSTVQLFNCFSTLNPRSTWVWSQTQSTKGCVSTNDIPSEMKTMASTSWAVQTEERPLPSSTFSIFRSVHSPPASLRTKHLAVSKSHSHRVGS